MTAHRHASHRDADHDDLRSRLLDAALTHVAFDGWTPAALNAAARDIDANHGAALNAFPGGAAQMIEYWNRRSDDRMLAALESRDLSHLRFRDRVALAVRLRLEAAGNREAVRRGLAFLALPQNAALATRLLYRTVDAVWHGLGDRSTDFSFYTKRGLLAGVYGSTVLYWLDDRSPGHEATWAFLDRRIADVMRITTLRQKVEETVSSMTRHLPDPLGLRRDAKLRQAPRQQRRRRAPRSGGTAPTSAG